MHPAIHTEIEPPGMDGDPGELERPRLAIGCWLSEGDDTRRAGYSDLAPDAEDGLVVDAMARCMEGAAAMRSPNLLAALRHRMRS